MPSTILRATLVLFILATSFLSAPALAGSDPFGPDVFFRHAETLDAVISPHGDYLAIITRMPNSRYGCLVISTSDFKDAHVVARSDQTDVLRVSWINDDEVVVVVADLQNRGVRLAARDTFVARRDGSDTQQIMSGDWNYHSDATGSHIHQHVLTAYYRYLRPYDYKSEDIIVMENNWSNTGELRSTVPKRFNVRTGELQSMATGTTPVTPTSWLIDAKGQPRVFTHLEQGVESIYYRAPDSSEWKSSARSMRSHKPAFRPISLAPTTPCW
jgi:hypothetical protein